MDDRRWSVSTPCEVVVKADLEGDNLLHLPPQVTPPRARIECGIHSSLQAVIGKGTGWTGRTRLDLSTNTSTK